MEDEKVGSFFIENGKFDPERVINITLSACQKYSIPIVFVESNAYQGTLAFWMTKYLDKYKLKDTVRIVPMPSGTTSKFQRIKAFVKLLVSRRWHLIGRELYNKVTFQIYSYKISEQNNVDDIIDEQAMALKALNERRNLILMSQFRGTALYDLPSVQSNNTILDRLRRRS